MKKSHAASSQMSARTMAALIVLGLAVPGVFAADQHRSSDQAGNPGASGKTSVNRELQRLFNQSGQPMPSLETVDLPYATTPQMHRVRKSTAEPSVQKKKKLGLFGQVFRRFRRDKSVEEAATPEPPPIVMGNRQTIGRRKARSVANNRRPQDPRDITNHQSQSLQQSQQDSAGAVQDRLTVRPVSQPLNVTAEQAGSRIPHVDMTSIQEEFEKSFKDGAVLSEGKVGSDRDAISDISDVADEAVFSSTDSIDAGFAEASESVEPEGAALNPFSGMRITADDEVASWFEESIVDVHTSESPKPDEAAGLIPHTDSTVSEVDHLGFVEYYELLLSGEAETDSASVETQGLTDFDSEWQARLMSDELPSVERTNEFAPGERRLAKVDRVSAERQEAKRWRQASVTGAGVEQRTEERSLSEYATVHSASAAPKVSLQQTRRQKIESRRHLTGFMGFCPVTLREDRDLADVSEEYEARFGLKAYHFSSADACDRFKANPTRYAPAAGGADVVALVNSGEQHAGSLEFAMWYRDRLYLFCSHETVSLFRADPAIFGDQY